MDEFNSQELHVAKEIVSKVVIQIASIQRKLLKEVEIPSSEQIWTLNDLREQIWRDMKANSGFISTVKKISQCPEISEAISEVDLPDSLEGYAKELCDMVTPIPNKPKRKRKRATRKKAGATKQTNDNWNKPVRRARTEWNSRTGALAKQDWKTRYKAVYGALLAFTPKWKRNVIESKPDDRLSAEFAKDVVRVAENFDEYYDLAANCCIDANKIDSKVINAMTELISEAGSI